MRRYRPEDLSVLTPEEWDRWIRAVRPSVPPTWTVPGARGRPSAARLAWELLYRIEPGLYERLVAGEHIHRGIVEWLPPVDRAVEVGRGARAG